MSAATYINPFHSPNCQGSQQVIKTTAKPKEYRSLQIFERICGTSFEVVQDGVCIAMRAGPNGAKAAIDNMLDNPEDFWAVRMLEALQRGTAIKASGVTA